MRILHIYIFLKKKKTNKTNKMTSHFTYQMPKEEIREKWFFYNAFMSHRLGFGSSITPEMVKWIYDAGFTRIYLSFGSKYAEAQQKVQLLDEYKDQMEQLEGVEFDAVIIDSLNAPHVSIKDIFPCRTPDGYMMGEEKCLFDSRFYNSWKDQAINPWKIEESHESRIIFEELSQGPNCTSRNFDIMGRNCWRKLKGLPLELFVIRPTNYI